MEKKTDNIKKQITENNLKKNKDNIIEDDFWDDNIELNNDFKKYNINININTPKQNIIIKDNKIKDTNTSIILKKIQKDKVYYNNYFNKKAKSSKKPNSKIKLHKCSSASNVSSKNMKNKRFNKLYEEGLISIKKRMEKSMEEKIKRENEYKNYSYSPVLYTHSPLGKNHKKNKNNEKKTTESNKKKIIINKNKFNDIYERNKKWKETIEDRNIKQRMLKKKNTETKIKFKPIINDCIMKTDEEFINKNSIEYQAFIDKINVIKNKENIYGKNQKKNNVYRYGNNIKTKNKPKYSLEFKNKNKNVLKDNKIKEMNKIKSFNNRKIFNINKCRKKYGLSEFFNINNYDTIINKDNGNGLNSNNKELDVNELYFKQQIFNNQLESSIGIKQTCFNFNDALLKLMKK